MAYTTRAGPRDVVWLAERPVRWGGTWGLGCKLCADSVARVAVDGVGSSPAGAKSRRLGTAWARFEVRAASLQAEHIRQHQEYDVHRVATLAWLRPDSPVTLSLQADLSDDRLLAGSVPQPCDWLRAWRAARTPQSWQAAAETLQTEHFIRQTRDKSVLARPLEQMAVIMQEVLRLNKREVLRQSQAISLSFDDRKGYKLVRYRAALCGSGDQALAAPQGAVASEGIFGCIQCLRGSSLEELADDYAARAASEVLSLISEFCTPLGDVKDENLFSHVKRVVRSVCCDGALQKVAACLRSELTEIVLIQRDPAHFIRIACKEPLVRTGRFEAQHARLFTAKHALLKSVQFSDSLQARLEACQKMVVQSRGSQGGGVRHIMRHFSFAAHRFESWTGPRRKYACCVHAVALLLCEMAGDPRRNLSERRNAQAALEAMTPRDMLEVGLAADFGEVCMRFIREFDVSDRDPSRTAARLCCFEDTLRKLFVDGYILVPTGEWPSSDAPAAPQEHQGKTITQIIFEQLEDMSTLRYGSKLMVLWNRVSKEEAQTALREIGQIVEDCLERLRVDFGTDLYMTLEALDIRAWHGATGQRSLALRAKARQLCEALGVTFIWETWHKAIRSVELVRRSSPDPDNIDNRALWTTALAASQGTGHVKAYAPIVKFFASITDGTGSIERFLGSHASFLAHHQGGPDNHMAAVCLEIAKEGPAREEDLFEKDPAREGVLLLTPWSRKCCQLWRSLHGRRFACYKERKDKGRHHTGWRLKGSVKAVGIMHEKATNTLVNMAQTDAELGGRATPRTTLLGIEHAKLTRHLGQREIAAPTQGLLNFRKTTNDRRKKKATRNCWPGFDTKPPDMRRKPGMTTPTMVGAPKAAPVAPQGPKIGQFAMTIARRKRNLEKELMPPCKRSRVTVKSYDELYSSKMDSTALLAWLPAVGLGLPMTTGEDGAAGESQVQQHAPAIHNDEKLHFTAHFCRKHPQVLKVFRGLIAKQSSKWVECTAESKCTVISCLQECQAFLQKVRNFQRAAGVHASFLTESPETAARTLSRFGRPSAPRGRQILKRAPAQLAASSSARPRWLRKIV